ncbi:MAG TPA: hypothetical protein IAA22_05105 [Candidatus Olsenella stercoravium]|uniref:Uncharacterized protein n=1 Tax=Candidatus Olsenella stercoravium TaxID=2838713 RepID=A0A9D2IPI7_9ACTN|nr:hypothetical protein [Candidatus Olsenella stercoravium]
MPTDDERRAVARRLRRSRSEWSGMGWRLWLGPKFCAVVLSDGNRDELEDAAHRLADLIEPDTNSDTTKSGPDTTKVPNSHPNSGTAEVTTSRVPKCDPTERGVDSIYDWCFERLEGADGAEDELYCSIMRAIEDYRHPERATAHTVRPVDRDALLALADEMDAYTKCDDERCGKLAPPRVIHDFARLIRDALGVQDA